MSYLRYAAFFLLCYLVFLAAGLPADLVWKRLDGRIPAGVSVARISGTWLSGRAGGVVSPLVRLEEIRWRLHPLSLLSGRAAARITASGAAALRGEVEVWRGGFAVRGLSGRIAAGEIKSPLPLAGEFICQGVELEGSGGRLDKAAGVILWRRAGVGAWSELGDLRITLGSGDGGVNARISGENGLDLAAELRLSPDGAVWLRGTARPAGPDQEAVFSLLGAVGPDGRVKMNYNGRVPVWR